MKTTKEWCKEVTVGAILSGGEHRLTEHKNTELIKQIQLDAWKQGMLDSTYIALRLSIKTPNMQRAEGLSDLVTLIKKEIENKTTEN